MCAQLNAAPCNPPAPQARPSIFVCQGEILKELETNAQLYRVNPEAAFELIKPWDEEFRKRYYVLRYEYGQDFSKSDAELITEEIWSELNPANIAIKQGTEYVVKRWFKQLTGLLAFLSSATVKGVTAYFIPSQIGSDLDELVQANDLVHKKLAEIVMPAFFDINWRTDMVKQIEAIDPMATAAPTIGPRP